MPAASTSTPAGQAASASAAAGSRTAARDSAAVKRPAEAPADGTDDRGAEGERADEHARPAEELPAAGAVGAGVARRPQR